MAAIALLLVHREYLSEHNKYIYVASSDVRYTDYEYIS